MQCSLHRGVLRHSGAGGDAAAGVGRREEECEHQQRGRRYVQRVHPTGADARMRVEPVHASRREHFIPDLQDAYFPHEHAALRLRALLLQLSAVPVAHGTGPLDL